MMKSIVVEKFGGPEVLQIQEKPIPEVVPKTVLVRLASIGVNPYETYLRAGIFPTLPQLPYTPGTDGAGVVEKVGEGVTNFKVGDRVIVYKSRTGTYAEYCLSDESDLSHLPANSTFHEGASIGIPYLTAYLALVIQGQAKPGERIFVHGATGGVGIATVQIAKVLGMYVIATTGTEEGKKLLLSQGADVVLNHREQDYLKDLSNVDVCIEMLANVNLQADLGVMALNGRISIVGCRGPINIEPRVIMAKQLKVVGVMLRAAPQEDYDASLKAVLELLESGKLKPIIGQVFKLSETSDAHVEVIEHKNGSQGKVVISA
eukprot:c1766_g1_i1.p1 GENE.c1766_g1_i1~~c1766_g1_i1.p1  ORF type:complete len:326 (-),score=186.71 c1766_g1_i1:116-1069(-)